MAIAYLQELDQDITEQYDAVSEKLNARSDPPPGLIVHTAARTPDGGFRIFDVWESEEAFERFNQERISPAMAEVAGDATPPEPTRREIYELHDLVKP